MGSIEPGQDRIARFLQQAPRDQPIVMINLLRYADQASYAPDSGETACTGREAYARYSEAVFPLLAKVGGRPIWMGAVASTVISPDGEEWDDAALIEYPSRDAFIEMTSSPAYRAIVHHRTAALADSRLIATTAASALAQG